MIMESVFLTVLIEVLAALIILFFISVMLMMIAVLFAETYQAFFESKRGK